MEVNNQTNKSREEKLFTNSLIIAIGTVLPRLASFITLPIVTSGLTKEEYGTYDLILVLVSLLLPAVTLQIHVAAFRFIIDLKDNSEEIIKIVSSIYAVIIPLSLIALLILFMVMTEIESSKKILICIYLLIDIIVVSLQWIIRSLGKNFHYSVSAITNSITRMILCILFISIFHYGLNGVLISQIISNFITLFYLLYVGKILQYIDVKSISFEKAKLMISYSWPLVPNDLSMWVIRVSDRLLITSFMGVSVNAVYAVANKIPQLLSIFQGVFTKAWQESASLSSNDQDVDIYYSSMFSFIFNFVSGGMGVLIAMTPIIFKLLIRGDYAEAYYQMPILFLAMFFNSITAFIGGVYVACKSTKSIAITTFFAAVSNIVINLALIKQFGLYAASISTLISYAFLAVYRMIDIRKLVKITYDIKHMIIVIIIIIFELLLCFFKRPILDIINVIIGIYLFLFLNKNYLKILMQKIKRKIS